MMRLFDRSEMKVVFSMTQRNTSPFREKGCNTQSAKQGPRMLSVIRAACRASYSACATLFSYQLLVYIFTLTSVAGESDFLSVPGLSGQSLDGCKHKQDVQVGSTSLYIMNTVNLVLILMSLSPLAHSCRYFEFGVVGVSRSLVSLIFSYEAGIHVCPILFPK